MSRENFVWERRGRWGREGGWVRGKSTTLNGTISTKFCNSDKSVSRNSNVLPGDFSAEPGGTCSERESLCFTECLKDLKQGNEQIQQHTRSGNLRRAWLFKVFGERFSALDRYLKSLKHK